MAQKFRPTIFIHALTKAMYENDSTKLKELCVYSNLYQLNGRQIVQLYEFLLMTPRMTKFWEDVMNATPNLPEYHCDMIIAAAKEFNKRHVKHARSLKKIKCDIISP